MKIRSYLLEKRQLIITFVKKIFFLNKISSQLPLILSTDGLVIDSNSCFKLSILFFKLTISFCKSIVSEREEYILVFNSFLDFFVIGIYGS